MITTPWSRNFERDAVGLIAKNPDVKFDIYFPPYSILQCVAMRDASPATLKIVYDFHGLYQPAAGAVSERYACMIFARRRTSPTISNNYGDVVHHSPTIDLKVLAMAGEREIHRRPRRPDRHRWSASRRRSRRTGWRLPASRSSQRHPEVLAAWRASKEAARTAMNAILRGAQESAHLRMTIEPVGWAKVLFAPCPPSGYLSSLVDTLRFAHPTIDLSRPTAPVCCCRRRTSGSG